MIVKTLQWNIGGGKLLKGGEDPMLLASYSVDGLKSIAELIKHVQADIVTLNEVQGTNAEDQARELSEMTGLVYCSYKVFSDSHIESGKKLGMAILSRFPIIVEKAEIFLNPKYRTVWEDGSMATSVNKGILTVTIYLPPDKKLIVQTLHATPFRRYKIEPMSKRALGIRQDMASKINTEATPYLLQGDFNYNDPSINVFLPWIFKNNLVEIKQNSPTTPKGRHYDHILYRGMELKGTKTLSDVKTDHYPVFAEFEIQ